MTTIAYKDGIVACDSQQTTEGDGSGSFKERCTKLYPKTITYKRKKWDILIATAGATYPALVFVDWYDGTPKEMPDVLKHINSEIEDFDCLIIHPAGLFSANWMCRPVEIEEPFYAIGSGRKAAMAAMYMGASAKRAVEIACKLDPYTAPPIRTLKAPTLVAKKCR